MYNINKHVANILVELRSVFGFTQKEVADRLGVKQSQVARAEKGSENITIVRLRAFAVLYGVKCRDILMEADRRYETIESLLRRK